MRRDEAITIVFYTTTAIQITARAATETIATTVRVPKAAVKT